MTERNTVAQVAQVAQISRTDVDKPAGTGPARREISAPSLVEPGVLIPFNSQPDIVSVLSGEYTTTQPSPLLKRKIIEKIVEFSRLGTFFEKVFVNFLKEMHRHVRTRSGIWYRSAFLCGLRAGHWPIADFDDELLYVSVDPHSALAPIMVNMAVLKTTCQDPILTNSASRVKRIYDYEVSTIFSQLSCVKDVSSTVDIQKIHTRDLFISLLGMNVEARAYALITKSWLSVAEGPTNLERAECQRVLFDPDIRILLSQFEENGLIDLELPFPLREVGSTKHLRSLYLLVKEQHVVEPSVNQMMASLTAMTEAITRTPNIAKNVEQTTKIAESAMNKVDNLVDNMNESVDKLRKDVSEAADTINSARPLISQLSDLFEPIFKMAEGISTGMSKAVEAFRHLWDFSIKFMYAAFPIVFAVTIFLLKPWLSTAMVKTLFALVAIVGTILYGYAISEHWSNWLSSMMDWWSDHARGLTADEGFESPESEAEIASGFGATLNTAEEQDLLESIGVDPTLAFGKPSATYMLPSHHQAGLDVITLTAALYCMIGVDPTKKMDVIKALKAIPGVAAGAEAVVQAIKNFFMTIASRAAAYLGMEPAFASILSAQYGEWLSETEKYVAKDKALTLTVNDITRADLASHIEAGTTLAFAFEHNNQKTACVLITAHLRVLENVLNKLDALFITRPIARVEPVSCLIMGTPGSGKTLFTEILSDCLARYELRDSQALLKEYETSPLSFIHVRSAEKWFEGYDARTLVMRHDEFPLTKETTPDDSKQVALIDEINTTPKALPMANADQKGKFFYNHKYTLLTSNGGDFKSEFLICQGALERRLHVVIQLESRGIPNSEKGVSLDPNNWIITLMQSKKIAGHIEYESTGLTLTIEQLFTLLVGIRRLREINAKDNKGLADELVSHTLDSAEDRAYFAITRMYNTLHQRNPTQVELFAFARNNRAALEGMSYNMSFLDSEKKKGKAKESVPFVSPMGDGSELPSHEQALAPVNRWSLKIKNFREMYQAIREPSTDLDTVSFFQAMGATLEARLRRVPPLGFSVDGSSTTIGMSLDLDVDAEKARPAVSASLTILANTFAAGQGVSSSNKIEVTLGVLTAFGKYHVMGFRVPSIETYMTHSLRAINGDGARNDRVLASVTVTKGGATLGLASMLAGFMESIGMSNVFGLTHYESADLYCNEVDLVVWLSKKSFQLSKAVYLKVKDVMSYVWQVFTAYNEGSMTAKQCMAVITAQLTLEIVVRTYDSYHAMKQYIETISNKMHNVALNAFYWIRKYGHLVVASVAAIALSAGVLFYRPGGSLLVHEYVNQDSSVHTKKYIARSKKNQKWSKVKGTTENQENIHWFENVLNPVKTNCYSVVSPSGVHAGYGLFIARKRFLMLEHYWESIKTWEYEDDAYLVIRREDVEYRIRESAITLVKDWSSELRDLVILDLLDSSIPLHRDITTHFVEAKDNSLDMLSHPFKITFVNPAIVWGETAVLQEVVPDPVLAKIVSEVKIVGKPTPNIDCIAYPIPTKKGDCGSLIFYKGKIVGLHAHGNGGWGQATRVSKEMLFEAYYEAPVGCEKPDEFEDLHVDPGWIYVNESYDPEVRSPIVVAVAKPPANSFVKQDIVRWNAKGPLQPSKVPVNATISNYGSARVKYGPKDENIDYEVMDVVSAVYSGHINRRPNPNVVKRILSATEAVVGVKGTSIDPMDHTSSPGFPFNYTKTHRKKIYEVDPKGKFVPGPEWNRVVDECNMDIKLMCNDYSPMYVFTDMLKSELRDPEKIDKPRLISGSPFVHTILSRSHFAGFSAHLADTWLVGDTLIGVDPHRDSDVMERQFLAKGDGIRECTGDYSAYDASRSPEMAEILCRIINRWYGDDEDSPQARVRQMLFRTSIINAHIYDRFVDLWSAGWSSGAYLTAIAGSMKNTLLNMYACGVEAKRLKKDWEDMILNYFDNVAIRVLGDDIRFAVTEDYSFHNNLTCMEILASHFNMKYTSASKTEVQHAFDPPENRSLLKRKALWCAEDKRHYWAIDIETIVNMCCYTIKGKEVEVMIQRTSNAIRELAFHNKETWDNYLPLLRKQAGSFYMWNGLSQSETRKLALAAWHSF